MVGMTPILHLTIIAYLKYHSNSIVIKCHDSDSESCSSGRNNSLKSVSRFLKMEHFVGYWWPYSKCTVTLANQNGFWSAKCWNWKNGQWPAVISRTVQSSKVGQVTITSDLFTHTIIIESLHKCTSKKILK